MQNGTKRNSNRHETYTQMKSSKAHSTQGIKREREKYSFASIFTSQKLKLQKKKNEKREKERKREERERGK